MSQDKIESRRTFMKTFGKLAACAVATIAGMTLSVKEADAQYGSNPQFLKSQLEACERGIEFCRRMEEAAKIRGDILGAQRWARQRMQYEALRDEILRRIGGGGY